MYLTTIDTEQFDVYRTTWFVHQCQKVRENEKVGEILCMDKVSQRQKTINLFASRNGYIVALHGNYVCSLEYYEYGNAVNVIPEKKEGISSQVWFVIMDDVEECYAHFPILGKIFVEYKVHSGKILYFDDLKVKKNDVLYKLHKCGKIKDFYADIDGYAYCVTKNLPILIDSENEISNLIVLYPNLESLILERFYNDYIMSIPKDKNVDFNKTFYSFLFNKCDFMVIGKGYDIEYDNYSSYRLSAGVLNSKIEVQNEKLMFCIYYHRQDLTLKVNDQIELYFSNSKNVSFTITDKPATYNAYQDIAKFELFKEDLEIMSNEEFLYTKVTIGKNKKEKFFNYNKVDKVESLLKILYVKTFYDWHCSMGGIVNSIPMIEEQKNISDGECYVYLMLDTKNHFHKIGISNNPTYREKTLQGDKPSIIKLAAKKYPSRKIAAAIESALHNAFSEKRVRGEWFNLNDEEVNSIIETLI